MNSERLKLNRRKDKMFIPMNVEGGGYDEKFLNTTKILSIVGMAVGWIVIIAWLNSLPNATFAFRLITILALLFVSSLIIRFIVFEESYFYKMYKKTLTYSDPTSDVFWNISSIKDTQNGSILLFSDLKIGVFVKLKRGSIIGKNKDFMEQHYDAVSDFLSEIVGRGYMFVHLNMMERADNDDRLDKLALQIAKTSNPNMKRLLELQTGHLRNTTRNTLYESDYYLIYTDRAERFDNIIRDVEDCLEFALNGSYNGYFELDKREVIDVHKELMGVSYFDYNSATVNTFREFQIDDTPAITIKRINLASGSVVDISKPDDALLRKIAKEIDYSTSTDINVMKMLAKHKNSDYRLRAGIDLDKVPSVKDTSAKVDTGVIKKAINGKKKNKKDSNKKQEYGIDLSNMELESPERYITDSEGIMDNELGNDNLGNDSDNLDLDNVYPIEDNGNYIDDSGYPMSDDNSIDDSLSDSNTEDSNIDYESVLNNLSDEDDEEIEL